MATNFPTWEQYRSVRHFAALDGFRCASILLVLWHHAGPPIAWLPLSNRGFLGVDIFFVISGFLIVTLLLRERDRSGTISLSRFYARRTLRIFPVYYGLLLALAIFFFLYLKVRPDSGAGHQFFVDLPYYLTYTSNWAVGVPLFLDLTWSLAAEEQFYLVWPPLEKYLPWRGVLTVLLVLLLVNQLLNFSVGDAALRAWLGFGHSDLYILQITFTPILFGVLLAHLLHHPAGFRWAAGLLGWRYSSLALLAVLFVIANLPASDISGLQRLSFQIVAGLLLASCVLREDNVLAPLLTWGPIRRLGVISYGMYIYHMLLRAASVVILIKLGMLAAGESSVTNFLLCTALTVLTAELSYRFFETPLLKLKDRFSSEPKARQAKAELAASESTS